MLPFHETNVFVRMLQIINVKYPFVPSLLFLIPYRLYSGKQSGSFLEPAERTVLRLRVSFS